MPITTTPSGGPQGEFSTYTPIYAQTLSGSTSSITFSNIPTTFTDLKLVVSGITTVTGYAFTLSVNSDTGSNYSQTLISGNGTSAQSARYSSSNNTNMYIGGWVSGYDSTAPSTLTLDFMNYSNTTTNKTILWRSNSGTRNTEAGVMLWRNTAPITTITVSSQSGASMATGSTFTLYGIKAAATQFIPSKASGGDVVVSDGTYAYHAFLTSGTFRPAQSLTCDVLVVAGGGGGSQGGGGAGGLAAYTGQSLTTTNYTITVGGGGAGITNSATNQTAFSGSNSTFQGLTAAVGGGGAGDGANGLSGGSGGGGGYGSPTRTGGTPTSGQGNAGGSGGTLSDWRGGGGGGAGAAGGNSNGTSQAGNGGIGSTAYSSWGSTTGTGQLSSGTYYYAGGGGGGSINSGVGSGGLGGGGAGALRPNTGARGTAFTGGGGGGAEAAGGAGGSGIVIVRYPV